MQKKVILKKEENLSPKIFSIRNSKGSSQTEEK